MSVLQDLPKVLRTGNPLLDRQMILFSDERGGRMEYLAHGLRQFKRAARAMLGSSAT